MEGGSSLSLLFGDFPELQSQEIILEKEVLAHFGLLFSRYALLETGLQNCYIFWQLHASQLEGSISDQAAWELKYDFLERRAHASTFGTLLKLLADCTFLSEHQRELTELKRKRDYFAHHFFREENGKMFSRKATLLLLDRMNKLRRQVKVVERHVDSAAFSMISEIYPSIDISTKLTKLCTELEIAAQGSSDNSFGWE